MMREVFIVSDNIISPLGFTTEDNFHQLKQKKSGISHHINRQLSPVPFYASLLSQEQNNELENTVNNKTRYTRFELFLIQSISKALKDTHVDPRDATTGLIISTTKGNIGLLETEKTSDELRERVALYTSAKLVAEYFGLVNKPVVVSNACISGLTALVSAKRMIQAGQYKHVIVTGADVMSRFILSGFQSFQAVSDKPCRPFDKDRNGVTLGEASATIILSSENPKNNQAIQFVSGAVSNDANHISGPSRTGRELCIAVDKALNDARLSSGDIAFISAHGTATVYNDEMEAKAFSLSNLQDIPINSLKGYYGHTLGAAGIVESIVSIHSLRKEIVLPTAGFEQPGPTTNINICNKVQSVKGNALLKTASGFGGCNAAVVFRKAYS